jgi:hypothetical protein
LHVVAHGLCSMLASRVLHRSAGQVAEFEGSGLAGFSVILLALEERHDRHGVAMPEREVVLEPGHHGARFHAGFKLAALRETLLRREPAEVHRTLAGLRLNVVEVGLK